MTVNIIHRKCENPVYQDLGDVIKILGTFGLGTRSTKMSLAYLQIINRGQRPISYYCVNCATPVKIEDLNGYCGFCGSSFPVEKLFRQVNETGKPVGDISCLSCLEKYRTGDEVIPLTSILTKVYIQG